jgi:hypothetical protein
MSKQLDLHFYMICQLLMILLTIYIFLEALLDLPIYSKLARVSDFYSSTFF